MEEDKKFKELEHVLEEKIREKVSTNNLKA